MYVDVPYCVSLKKLVQANTGVTEYTMVFTILPKAEENGNRY